MKLQIETKSLQEALKTVGVATDAGISLPILQGVRIEALGKKLCRFSATNLDLFCSKTIEVKASEGAGFVISHDLLSRLVNRFEDSTTTIEYSDRMAIVTCGQAEASIETLPADEFPPDVAQDEKADRAISAQAFVGPIAKVEHSMSDDRNRYTLCGVNLRPNGNGTDFAATNSTRLSVYHGEDITDKDVIVSDTYVRALLKLGLTGEATINISEGAISITCNGVKLSGKLVEATFPQWKNVIPGERKHFFTCRRAELTKAIQTCSIFTQREMPGLILSGKKKEIEVAKLGKARVNVLGTDLNGQPDFQIGIHSRHLLETLSVLEKDEVRIQCVDDNTPYVIEEGPLTEVLSSVLKQ